MLKLPFAVCILSIACECLFPSLTDYLASVPFLISALFLGIPHGALDWADARDSAGNPTTSMMISYLTWMFATGATLFYAPHIGLLSFFALSIWHFGRDRHRYLGVKPSPIFTIGRGIVVVAAPFIFAPAETTSFVGLTSTLVQSPKATTWSLSGGRLMLGFVYGAGVVVEIAWWFRCWRNNQTGVAIFCATETIVLTLAAAALNPVFYVGLYFLFVHSWAALAHRLKTTDWRNAVKTAFGLHRDDGPLAWLSWLLIGSVGLGVRAGSDLLMWAAIVVLFYAVVTPAHLWLSWVRSNDTSAP